MIFREQEESSEIHHRVVQPNSVYNIVIASEAWQSRRRGIRD